MYGIKVEEKKEVEFKPRVCPRCNKENSPGSKFCSLCSLVLDLRTAIELDSKMEAITELFTKILEDPKSRRMIIRESLKKGLKDRLKSL